MRWFKKSMRKISIAIASMLLFLMLMAWIPVSAGGVHERASGPATPVTATVQATATVDATVTTLSKEQLTLQVKQLQNQLQNQNNWVVNNSTALIAAVASVVVALFGILQWAITVRQAKDKDLRDQKDERRKEVEAQDKDLKAQAEERFKTAVTALGGEKESVQIGGAILLRSFLNKDDKSYEQYYTQVFDLAVAYLRLPRIPLSPEDPKTPLPLTTLSQALIVVFKEAFPLARDRNKSQNKGDPESLDATGIQLDNAYLSGADLQQAWMPLASLRKAKLINVNLNSANLTGASLVNANLTDANLNSAKLVDANLERADLKGAHLDGAQLLSTRLVKAQLSGARLVGANFEGADLRGADLRGANLSETMLAEEAFLLEDTDLRGVDGLEKEQLEACKAKGAIIDEDFTTSPSQSPISLPPSSQKNNAQAQSAPSVQESKPTSDTGGNSATSSQQSSKS